MGYLGLCVLSRYNVPSGNKLDICKASLFMPKLNKRKIRWIVREMQKQNLSVYQIAKTQKITTRHARRVYQKYKFKNLYDSRTISIRIPGRKARQVQAWEKELITNIYHNLPMGAVNIERLLKQSKNDLKLSHNRIHKILLQLKLSKPDYKKSKPRKWVRYERRFSNSLWHTDWSDFEGEQIIVFVDDASRFITGFGHFSNATSENSAKVLRNAVSAWGAPKQLMSDHGVQFTSFPRETCENPEQNIFQKTLAELGIKHIKSRVKHPQSNGKAERLIGTLKRLYKHFRSWDKVVEVYNFKRPHMSLDCADGSLRTPYTAFVEKRKKKSK